LVATCQPSLSLTESSPIAVWHKIVPCIDGYSTLAQRNIADLITACDRGV